MSERRAPARLLWDQGGLWSLMTLQACLAHGLAIAPITAAEVASGELEGARLLLVPGGWPALKRQALGKAGRDEVRRFVRRGGYYLGLCGGAGLALDVKDGLGLVPLTRERGGGRLPALSGPLLVEAGPGASDHPFWQGLEAPAVFHVWWPGQFAASGEGVRVLAVYDGPLPGLFTSDLCAMDITGPQWPGLEASYGIQLRPEAIAGQAAVIEAECGQGRALLSYLHLDTPGDESGGRVLTNLWRAWLGPEGRAGAGVFPAPSEYGPSPGRDLIRAAARLWSQGMELGLWRERHPAMPLWRRGVRGLEFWTLHQLCLACAAWADSSPTSAAMLEGLQGELTPVWTMASRALQAQAARLAGEMPESEAARVEARWFPQPRRVAEELASALAALERVLLLLIRLKTERQPL